MNDVRLPGATSAHQNRNRPKVQVDTPNTFKIPYPNSFYHNQPFRESRSVSKGLPEIPYQFLAIDDPSMAWRINHPEWGNCNGEFFDRDFAGRGGTAELERWGGLFFDPDASFGGFADFDSVHFEAGDEVENFFWCGHCDLHASVLESGRDSSLRFGEGVGNYELRIMNFELAGTAHYSRLPIVSEASFTSKKTLFVGSIFRRTSVAVILGRVSSAEPEFGRVFSF